MWARRCGAPPMWPSRAKVLLQSFMTAAVGITIFNFMASADVGYLDLRTAKGESVLCLNRWPLRHETESWWSRDIWIDWFSYRGDMHGYVMQHLCTTNATMATTSCNAINVPLHDMKRKLGTPLGPHQTYSYTDDLFEVYSHIFLWLTVCLWIAVVVHDFTLLSRSHHEFVLDLSGVDRDFPWLKKMCLLTGAQRVRRLASSGSALALAAAVALAPLLALWTVFVVVTVMCPVMMFLFLVHPIKLGRIQIFLLSLIFSGFSITLVAQVVVNLAAPSTRPGYAITWEIPAAPSMPVSNCICGCVYPMSPAGLWKVLFIAVIVTYKSIMLGFRCLKGLRRCNWANLMTVMFAIPLTVYPSEWTRPDGSPIKFRKPGEAVQGELAFDPFAMLDEQDDSALSTVELKPSLAALNPSKVNQRKSRMSAPGMSSEDLEDAEFSRRFEEIGCCGFPCQRVLRGRSGRSASEATTAADEEAPSERASAQSRESEQDRERQAQERESEKLRESEAQQRESEKGRESQAQEHESENFREILFVSRRCSEAPERESEKLRESQAQQRESEKGRESQAQERESEKLMESQGPACEERKESRAESEDTRQPWGQVHV